MKVCIPTIGNLGLEDQVGEHFGRVPTYTCVDTETNEIEIIDNTSEHMGGVGYPPDLIAEAGVEVMICSGLGRRAILMFQERGIMVYIGAYGTVGEVLQMWKDGQLQAATDESACAMHTYRGEGKGPDHTCNR